MVRSQSDPSRGEAVVAVEEEGMEEKNEPGCYGSIGEGFKATENVPSSSTSTGQQHNAPLVKKYCRVFIAIYFFGMSILFVAIPTLLVRLFGFPKAAAFQALNMGVERSINFVAAPMMGVLSDHIGRKPVIIISVLISCLPLIALGLWPGALTILLYYALNGFNAVIFMVYTVMNDITEPHSPKLAGVYGKLNVAICAGMVSGPLAAGLISKINILLPIRLSAALLVLCMIIIAMVPETRGQMTSRKNIDWDGMNPFKRIFRSCGTRRFSLLCVPYFFLTLGESVYIIFVLYLMKRYGWSKEVVGMAISLLAICQATVQGSIKYLIPRYLSEMKCAIIGLLSHIVASLIMGLSPKGWMLAFAIVFHMGGGLKSPAMLSILTSAPPEKSRGTLQGSLQSLRAASLVVSGPLYSGILAFCISNKAKRMHNFEHANQQELLMGLPFYVAATCDLIAVITAGIAFRRLAKLEALEAEAAAAAQAEEGTEPPGSSSSSELIATPERTGAAALVGM